MADRLDYVAINPQTHEVCGWITGRTREAGGAVQVARWKDRGFTVDRMTRDEARASWDRHLGFPRGTQHPPAAAIAPAHTAAPALAQGDFLGEVG